MSDPRENPFWQPPDAGKPDDAKDPLYQQVPVAAEPSTAYPEQKIRAAWEAGRKALLAIAAAVLVVAGIIVAAWPGPKPKPPTAAA